MPETTTGVALGSTRHKILQAASIPVRLRFAYKAGTPVRAKAGAPLTVVKRGDIHRSCG
ncbi:hypothetical protein CO2235_MP50049 [Cupriavidus oxalaticus]|uniref:Uncharacterized protein n=1 Tax=Cupriavidus oxalaticus TaxID=96344 RepID=A0A976BIG7_9BURK|nr:hypothetical protein CO2235_MP50049 [Cupriavidus oxalaticus]